MLSVRISDRYRRLRMLELELTADYLLKKQEEKEAERAERERLREEAKAQAEFRREIEKLEKERKHLLNVRQALLDKGDEVAAAKMTAELDNVEAGLQGLHDREANIRAGYVYVISNLGAFGPNMVKIGMTRRLNPTERVLELGDASVPFRYDTHIMFYSPDAVSLENALHRELSAHRVNKVNNRREFFHTNPARVHALLKKHAGEVLEYIVDPEALEFRQSTIGTEIPAETTA
jgi:seryl-tRNA synthetase